MFDLNQKDVIHKRRFFDIFRNARKKREPFLYIEDTPHIISSPTNYQDWLNCFDIMGTYGITSTELELLRRGRCTDADMLIDSFEKQLVSAVNKMISKYISSFNKNLETCQLYSNSRNVYDIYRIFETLAKNLNGCLFFMELDFMSKEFRSELHLSVTKEANVFWNNMLLNIYTQCTENHNPEMEDLYFEIMCIQLFAEGDLE